MEVPPIIGEGQPPVRPPPLPPRKEGKLKKLLGPFGVVLVLLGKFKGVMLPLLKFLPLLLKTGGTMVISIWFYAVAWGWKFSVGFVLLLFIHECGHLLAARRMGLKVSAPVFIPFFGAIILLKDTPRNAWVEAVVGIGGPLLGTVGALACAVLFFTGNPLYLALAHTGFLLNLFNLMPVGFLDGGRIVTAISPWFWVAGIIGTGLLMFYQFNPILLLIFITSLPRLFSLFRAKTEAEKRYYELTPAKRLLMTAAYFGLIAFLVIGMKLSEVERPREQAPSKTVASGAFNAAALSGL